LAIADAHGRMSASCSVQSDEEIVEFFTRHAPGDVIAAIDAPLVVRNTTGRRDCEADVQRVFGRYGAGPYPSNLGMPSFAAGGRGARLCAVLNLDLSVDSPASRRAVEVYPHPAMVVLLELERVIPYKAKPGRTLDSLTSAFNVLMTAMETRLVELRLRDTPRWAELRALAAGAKRKADLGRIEDEIDAIFCAHLAHRWHRDGVDGNDVFGDDAGGAIVVPRAKRRRGAVPAVGATSARGAGSRRTAGVAAATAPPSSGCSPSRTE
jgi:predicted RNase H-like nuclease